MSKLMDAVTRYRKIEDVTSPKDDAPPVYLMDELAELALSPEQAECIAEHISKRLATNSAVVKWKALRLVRHLCNRGCTFFQRSMQRYSGSIRELVHYQGQKDPFKGDASNQRVRETAKETIEILYASALPQTSSVSTAPKGRIQGFGSSFSAAPTVTSTESFSSRPQPQSGGSKMVGFGSDGKSHNMQTSSSSSDLTASVTSAVNNLSGLIKSQFPSGNKEHTSALHQRTGSYGESASYVDFGAGNSAAAANLPGRWGPQATGSLRALPIDASAVMGSEEQLVGDICAAVGVRLAPDPEDLRKFVESASSMDGLRIGELLIEKMTSPSWQVVLRSLHALEAVLQHGSSQACGEVAVMFQSDPSPVTRALSSAQGSVRERASCCLRLLLNEEAPEIPVAASRPSATHFNSGGNKQHQAAAAAAAPPLSTVATPASQAPVDLLGELDSGPAMPSHGPGSGSQPPPVSSTQDPFSIMDLSNFHISVPSISPPQVMQPVAAAVAPDTQNHVGAAAASNLAAKSAGPLDDFFSSIPSSVPGSAGVSHQHPGFGVLAGPSGFAPMPMQQQNQGFGSVPGSVAAPAGFPASVNHGFVTSSQMQQQAMYNAYAMPAGTLGVPGAVTTPSASASFAGSMPAPMATGDSAGKWMMQPAQTSWMGPTSQPSASSSRPGLVPAGSLANDAAFDFVKEHLK